MGIEMEMKMNSEGDPTASWPLLSWLASCIMVFGGVVPYVPQYQEILRTSSTEGFSTRVCLVLLVANILRIFFWFGKQFESPLLFQSMVMILTMLAMLHLCCSVQTTNHVSTKQHYFTGKPSEWSVVTSGVPQGSVLGFTSKCYSVKIPTYYLIKKDHLCTFNKSSNTRKRQCRRHVLYSDLDLRYFWSWACFEDYLLFCFSFTVLSALITFLFLDSVLFVEGVGSLAVLTEAMLGVPQLLQNFQNKSTRGMSIKMVLLWTAGDFFKTTYFLVNEAPSQFWLCGVAQICIDIAILLQVAFYKQETHTKYG
ncbi:PQLC1 protein, partial [Polyodon spathula]|nr:PQLC1 protein [Polyodon spathula]